ncbi:MAG: hypothetical protein RBR28_11095 [Lentimicrobium sp.]|jgi:hypothetical protein|nr:hypothetical protein [Lentimicrobium sp.]
MKRSDFIFAGFFILLFLPFFLSDGLYQAYNTFNLEHGFIMSFIKFAVLATLGEVIGLRIKTGKYSEPGFGLLPRALVWGLLGITIKAAFIIFTSGTLSLFQYLNFTNAPEVFSGGFSAGKLLIAFSISVFLNTVYAPVMMTVHKITDTHILNTGGTFKGFFTPIPVAGILQKLNWNVQWNFVFRKTIPFFWYPAHTITFLLPAEFQVLFAALLGIALGTILAIASLRGRE